MTTTDRTVGEVLEHDHHRIDAWLEKFAEALTRGEVDADSFAQGTEALRHHIYVEEALHFPPLKRAGLFGPIMVMLREHGEIWDLLDQIQAGIEAEESPGQVYEVWQHLEHVLREHNLKEERILYPAGDDILDEEQSDDILSTLAEAEMPDGWRCEMAGDDRGTGPLR